jgi:hypothetical protein
MNDIDLTPKDAWICHFDVLGFKALITESNEIDRRVFLSQLNDLLKMMDGSPQHISTERHIYSDTIILSAFDTTPKTYSWFMPACKRVMTKSLSMGLPMRAAISVGEIYSSSNPPILMGKAFIDAYEYGEDQNWIGLVLTPTAVEKIRQVGLEPLHHDFVQYRIPFRKFFGHKALAYRMKDGMTNFQSPLLPKLRELQLIAPDFAQEKYINTIKFMEAMHRPIPKHL